MEESNSNTMLAVSCIIIAIGFLLALAGILKWMEQPAHVVNNNNEKETINDCTINNNCVDRPVAVSTPSTASSKKACRPTGNTGGYGLKDCPEPGQMTYYCEGKIVDKATANCCKKDSSGVCYG